ncbi:hypothetical protein, partial [Specibacter sp. RAF43]|uniref:hypothetical protein n=1 Tax=Specibacter sp. RAF43 TaxID=3233057 RepID=UPI003F95F10B
DKPKDEQPRKSAAASNATSPAASTEPQGRTAKEIRRCLKRYLARRVYRTFNSQSATLNTA